MKNRKLENILAVIAAMNAAGIGVALFLQCGFGGDPIAVLCQGIQNTFGISFGNASVIFNLLIIGVAIGAAKKNLGLGTAAYALVSGYFIDFYSSILQKMHFSAIPYAAKCAGYFAGVFFLAAALAILITMKCGMNAVDAVLYAAEGRWGIPYQALRTAFDVAAVGTGFLLGGTVGWGTLLCASCTGILVRKMTAYPFFRQSSVRAESK